MQTLVRKHQCRSYYSSLRKRVFASTTDMPPSSQSPVSPQPSGTVKLFGTASLASQVPCPVALLQLVRTQHRIRSVKTRPSHSANSCTPTSPPEKPPVPLSIHFASCTSASQRLVFKSHCLHETPVADSLKGSRMTTCRSDTDLPILSTLISLPVRGTVSPKYA